MANTPNLAPALTDAEVEIAEDIAHDWGAEFPQGRFTPDGRGGARLTVSPREAVDLAARAYALGLSHAHSA